MLMLSCFSYTNPNVSLSGAHVTSYLGINNRVDYVTDASTGVETKTNVAWDDPGDKNNSEYSDLVVQHVL